MMLSLEEYIVRRKKEDRLLASNPQKQEKKFIV